MAGMGRKRTIRGTRVILWGGFAEEGSKPPAGGKSCASRQHSTKRRRVLKRIHIHRRVSGPPDVSHCYRRWRSNCSSFSSAFRQLLRSTTTAALVNRISDANA